MAQIPEAGMAGLSGDETGTNRLCRESPGIVVEKQGIEPGDKWRATNIVDISLSFAWQSRPKYGTADYKEHETCTNRLCPGRAAVGSSYAPPNMAPVRRESALIPKKNQAIPKKMGAFRAKKNLQRGLSP
jgi:hypothetical protein